MGKLSSVGLLIASAMIAVPSLSSAQTAASFDGTYAGVSRVLSNDSTVRHSCPPSGRLAPLTISNGSARAKWGDGSFEGTVAPDGTLRMTATNSAHFEGRVENGTVRGRANSYYCQYELTWQKRS